MVKDFYGLGFKGLTVSGLMFRVLDFRFQVQGLTF
jgi:hypothetical protein